MLILILTSKRDYAVAMRAGLRSLGEARIDVELDALRAMQLVPSAYELIVMDASMDAMDGLQLLLLLRQQAPATTFVIMGDPDGEASRSPAYQAGADLVLERPVTSEQIEKAVAAIGVALESASVDNLARDDESLVRITDIVETSCLSGDSVLLRVRGENQSGDIFVHGGDVFHAQFPGKSGMAAFQEMVHWGGGMARIKVLKVRHLPPRTIETPYRELLGRLGPVDPLPGGEQPTPQEALVKLPGGIVDAKLEFLSEAPPLTEDSGPAVVRIPHPSGAEETRFLDLQVQWKVDFMGELVEGAEGVDPERCALITSFLFRRLADVAVALEVDYFDRMTLWGPQLQQVLVADNLGVRHALFETSRATEEQRNRYVKWCHERNV